MPNPREKGEMFTEFLVADLGRKRPVNTDERVILTF